MQKFKAKLKNIPRNAHSQVPSSINSSLKKDESLSMKSRISKTQKVLESKLTLNNPEGDLPKHAGEQKLSVQVYVLNLEGKALMPTTPRNARKLLKEKKAKVIKRSPFTIQLLYKTTNFVQDITLGIDSGYGNIGFSATSNNKELVSGTVKLDHKTKERLENRRMYRRLKRAKLWYRKPRFNNRKRAEGWLPPSIQRRYDTHLNIINRIKQILPITKVIVEVAKFDIQKIEDPNIQGIGYQQGDLYQYKNMKSYVLAREKGLCEHCGKDFKGQSVHLHHRIPVSSGGTNRAENMMLLHSECHGEIHKDIKLVKKYKKASEKNYKASTFMNIINDKFIKDIQDVGITFGYITEIIRNEFKIEKSHNNDAFVISGGTVQERVKAFDVIQKHRNNRILQRNNRKGKGKKPAIRRSRYKIQPMDIFWVGGKRYISKGMNSYGKQVTYEENGKQKTFGIKKIEKYFNQGSFVWKY